MGDAMRKYEVKVRHGLAHVVKAATPEAAIRRCQDAHPNESGFHVIKSFPVCDVFSDIEQALREVDADMRAQA